MIKVALLGDGVLFEYFLRSLLLDERVTLVALVVKQYKGVSREIDRSLTIFTDHSQLLGVSCDVALSINYWRLIDLKILSGPTLGFFNLHHSYGLRFRGRYS